MKEILLVYPGRKAQDVNMPFPLLFLARALVDAGFNPQILDGHVSDTTSIDPAKYLFVGISAMTGRQVADGIRVANWVRSKSPHTTIVWGGPHATCLPDQTVRSPLVDIVVRGEGEKTIVELARAMESGADWRGITGITYLQEGRPVSTGSRDPLDVDTIGHLPYGLLDMGNYPNVVDKFEYLSSKGCPFDCGFCSNAANYQRTWRGKSPDVVLDELACIIDTFDPKRIGFIDANAFVKADRMGEICRGILERKWNARFYSMVRCDYASRYDDDYLALLKRAGFTEIAFGAESGSERVLEFINKKIKKEQVLDTVRKFARHGITPVISMIMGVPTETESELRETLDLYDTIMSIHPGAQVNGIFIFTPLPATRLERYIIDNNGYEPPQSLEAWGRWRWSSKSNISWVDKKTQRNYEAIYMIVRFMFVEKLMKGWSFAQKRVRHGSMAAVLASMLFNGVFSVPAHLRWKTRSFRLPLEWKVWKTVYSAFKGVD